jgi:hypothetical protein
MFYTVVKAMKMPSCRAVLTLRAGLRVSPTTLACCARGAWAPSSTPIEGSCGSPTVPGNRYKVRCIANLISIEGPPIALYVREVSS